MTISFDVPEPTFWAEIIGDDCIVSTRIDDGDGGQWGCQTRLIEWRHRTPEQLADLLIFTARHVSQKCGEAYVRDLLTPRPRAAA